MAIIPGGLEDVEKKRTESAALLERAGKRESAATTLSDEVWKAVRSARAERGISSLAQDVGTTTGQLASDPVAIKERLGPTVNPMDVDRITSAQRASNLATLAKQGVAMEQQEATVQDLINAGANQMLARAKGDEAEAQKLQVEANSMMEQLKQKLAERKQAFDEWATTAKLELDGKSYLDIPGLGSVDLNSLEYARNILAGSMTLKDLSLSEDKRAQVSSLVRMLAENPNIPQELWGLDPYQTVRGTMGDAALKLKYITEALKYIGGAGWQTGPVAGLWQRAAAKFNLSKQAEFTNLMSNLRSESMFSIGGKQLTDTEKKEIEPYLPGLGKSEAQNKVSLEKMYEKAKNAYIRVVMEDARDRGLPMTKEQAEKSITSLMQSIGASSETTTTYDSIINKYLPQ